MSHHDFMHFIETSGDEQSALRAAREEFSDDLHQKRSCVLVNGSLHTEKEAKRLAQILTDPDGKGPFADPRNATVGAIAVADDSTFEKQSVKVQPEFPSRNDYIDRDLNEIVEMAIALLPEDARVLDWNIKGDTYAERIVVAEPEGKVVTDYVIVRSGTYTPINNDTYLTQVDAHQMLAEFAAADPNLMDMEVIGIQRCDNGNGLVASKTTGTVDVTITTIKPTIDTKQIGWLIFGSADTR